MFNIMVKNSFQKILVTGAAGFVGFHTILKLLNSDFHILGIDNLNDYYSTRLKNDRLVQIKKVIAEQKTKSTFDFHRCDLNDEKFTQIWEEFQPEIVLHFAAQAGVRYSLESPETYVDSNILGFFKVLKCAQRWQPKHLLYATSSSVYGNSTDVPFSTDAKADLPISIYAATKRSNELFAATYSHLFHIPLTGLRFFTVYGSYGRPDMAYFKFTEAILQGKPITVYDYENQFRDFTHVSDIVESIQRLISIIPNRNDAFVQPGTRHRILNIGASSPTPLKNLVMNLEVLLKKKAVLLHEPAQPGDVSVTFADVKPLEELTNYRPKTNLTQGLTEFTDWYINQYINQCMNQYKNQ
jgi:UDP-glucuronate 4-epimerase